MQTNSLHIHPARAISSGVYPPPRTLTNSGAVTLTVIISVLVLAGCTKKDPVAGLTELPNDVAKTLRPIPGTRLLGNTIQQTVLEPPPIPAGTHCPANASITFYEAQITTPITVCLRPDIVAPVENAVFYSRSATTTYKLTDANVFADLKDATLWSPPFACLTSNGPWSAQITATRGCVGTCSPLHRLTVLGVPNNVLYVWYGALAVHPAGFEFVNTPNVTGQQDLGPCNPVSNGGGGIPRRQ